MKNRFLLYLILLLVGCEAKLPSTYSKSKDTAPIYPDYIDVTIPVNIAPLTFSIEQEAEEYACRMTSGEKSYIYNGRNICPSTKEWQELTNTSKRIKVEVFTQQEGIWTLHKPFQIHISPDSIDTYLAYRLIAPSYVAYEDLYICQRCLSSYQEAIIYCNMMNSDEQQGHCINCHSFQQNNPSRMQFHVRQSMAGTVIAYDGNVRKVNLNREGNISAGVYPAWHPTKKLIAYSTNTTMQTFHTKDVGKIEVQDTYSDLILYSIDKDQVMPLPNDSNELDCFPTWSPDGKHLYYCSAHFEQADTTISRAVDMMRNYQQIKYNLYRRTFDTNTLQFGERELVYDAATTRKSATLPRISPDGKWLLFTMAEYGVFHIWHKNADLYMMNLKDMQVYNLKEANSPQAESFHSWSSNGRWIVFSSRRDDGNFTRPFFSHIDKQGHATKPFELPCSNPLYNKELLRNYNIPEFIKAPVTISAHSIGKAIRQ